MSKAILAVFAIFLLVSLPVISVADETGTEDYDSPYNARWQAGFEAGWKAAASGRDGMQEGMLDSAFNAGWEAGYSACIADMLEQDLSESIDDPGLDGIEDIGDDDMESGPADAGL